jgi:hypothetical protein
LKMKTQNPQLEEEKGGSQEQWCLHVIRQRINVKRFQRNFPRKRNKVFICAVLLWC